MSATDDWRLARESELDQTRQELRRLGTFRRVLREEHDKTVKGALERFSRADLPYKTIAQDLELTEARVRQIERQREET